MNRALAWLGVAVALCATCRTSTADAESAAPGLVRGGAPPQDLPLAFEVNRGQADPRARFVAHARDMDLYLAEGGALLTLVARGDAKRDGVREAAALRLRFVGADPQARIEGVDALPGRAHYLLGHDPAKWHVDIPTFRRVRYRNVYPGIDVVYYGRDGGIEFDIEVAPGADPAVVRMRIDGARTLGLDDDGDLRIGTALGDVVQHRPFVYQRIGGERREVRCEYVLRGGGESGTAELAFAVGDFDPHHALVLDPTLVAAASTGGAGVETSAAVATDASGNWYFAGHTTSTGTGFPTTAGAYQTSNQGSADLFVRKVGTDGSTVLYSTLIGGSADDLARGLAVGATGAAWVVGLTRSTNYPVLNALQATKPSAGADAAGFVTVLNAAGNGLVYSTYLGGGTAIGPATTDVRDVVVDAAGNAYVTGETNTTDLPTSATAFQPTSMGQFSAFVFKLDASGARRFGTYIVDDDNGFGTDRASRIAIDAARNVYIVGQASASFANDYNGVVPAKIGPGGGTDVLLARLNHTGEWLDWITLAGGSALDSGAALDIDATETLMLAARSLSVDLAPDTAHDANWVWLAQIDQNGTRLRDSRWLGGAGSSSNIFARDLVWDGSRVVVVGDVQNPSALAAVDPVAALDCGASCGTTTTTGGFICSYTSDPLAVESCTRVIATGGSASGGVRYTGIARRSPLPPAAATGDESAKGAAAERMAVAGSSDGTSHGVPNTSGTTQQLVEAFIDFVFGPRQPFPPIVRKSFSKRTAAPGELVQVTITVSNPKPNPASIVQLTMEDLLPACLQLIELPKRATGLTVDASLGPVAIDLRGTEIPPGGMLSAEFQVKAGSVLAPCTNTTSPAFTNTGTAPPASDTLMIETNPCAATTTGACPAMSMGNASCWVGGVTPGNGCDAQIVACQDGGTCTVTNDQPLDRKIDTLTLGAPGLTFGGAASYIVGGIDIPPGGGAILTTTAESVDDELQLRTAGTLAMIGAVSLDEADLFDYGTGLTRFAGGIQGSGTLHVLEGTSRIETTAPTFAGEIFVSGGTLQTTVAVPQPITVRAAGLLSGEGPYGAIDLSEQATWSTSNGAIAAVTSTTVAVSDDARMIVDVDTPTSHDRVDVSGIVMLAGGTVELRALGNFDDGATYDVIRTVSPRGDRMLESDGARAVGAIGITGCFDGATTDEPGVTATVTCTAATVSVTVDVQADAIFAHGFENPP